MICNFTFRTRLDGRDGADVLAGLHERGDRMVRYHKRVLDWSAELAGDTVALHLRVDGTERWRVSKAARSFATALLATQHLGFQRPLQPELVTTEPNGRHLLAGEGRTPRGPYRPRIRQAEPS
jgi:hypothetical protein